MSVKGLDQYGVALHRYEGLGKANLSQGEPLPVYFEVRQVENGSIVIGCLSSEDLLLRDIQSVSGYTDDGTHLETSGRILVTHASMRSHAPSELHGICGGIHLSQGFPGERPTYSARFAIANFVFEPDDRAPHQEFVVNAAGHQVSFSPVAEYGERSKRLRHEGGVTQTAWCEVTKPARRELQMATLPLILDKVLQPISLTIGSKVTWLHWVAYDTFQQPARTFHRASNTKTFSNTSLALGWWNDLSEIVSAWFAEAPDDPIDHDALAARVDHYLDACARGPYLETRALSAATLLDVLAAKYAEATDSGFVIAEAKWHSILKQKITPDVCNVLEGTGGITAAERRELLSNARGLYRRSFRRRLTRMLRDYSIQVDSTRLNQIINTRNDLVHNGRFHYDDRAAWQEEYRRLLWVCRSTLLRMIGYRSDLPPLVPT